MSNPCPHCGGEMLDDTQDDRDDWWTVVWRCAKCDHCEEATIQPDGTIVAKGCSPIPPGWRMP